MGRRGDKTNQRIRNSILDLHLQIQKENKKKTREELGEDERFEDDPRALKEIEYGKVYKTSTHVFSRNILDDIGWHECLSWLYITYKDGDHRSLLLF